MSTTEDIKKSAIPPCPRCGKTYGITTRKDASIRCKFCGYDSQKDSKYICESCIGFDSCKNRVKGGLVISCKDFKDGVKA